MNRLAVLFLVANSLFAADFLTGQAARAVVGQPDFTAQLTGPPSAIYPGNMLLGAAGGVALANGTLVVADSSVFRAGADPQNNRVLIYNQIFGTGVSSIGPTQLPLPTAVPPAKMSTYWWCPVCGGAADIVLGQTDFSGTNPAIGPSGLRTPTAVATDGTHLAVADTDNNRVLLWNSMPTSNGQAADEALGQPDLNTVTPNTGTPNVLVPAANTLRGPEGVWIQGGKLYVADSLNNRVLIWNSWPTTNGQAADLVLGQPNFTTQIEGDLTKGAPPTSASDMLNPVSVTTDGTRLFVTDLGQNRVLVWNAIPTQNDAPADIALGQPDMATDAPDDAFTIDSTTGVETPAMCTVSNGTDTNGNPTYPPLCASTMSIPRFALSDGHRLFVSDGGNDRILIYQNIDTVPLTTGKAADVVLGQTDFVSDTVTDPTDGSLSHIAFTDAVRTPCQLAWDGMNLFVAEPFSRRVVVFTVGASASLVVPRNAASMEVFANGSVVFSGTQKSGDVITVTIQGTSTATAVNYTYTVTASDTLGTIATNVANVINTSNSNAGDPYVIAAPVAVDGEVRILARAQGTNGNNITLTASVSTGAGVVVTSTPISGGSDASRVAPAALMAIFGQGLSADSGPLSAPLNGGPLPNQLGSVQVFADGIPMPLLYTSASQINAQMPYEIAPATSVSVYVRVTQADGSVTITNAVGLPVVEGNPGIFAQSIADDGVTILPDPRPAYAVHSSNYATGAIDLEISLVNPAVGDSVTITIGSNSYTYSVPSTTTTLDNVRDGIIQAINQSDPNVMASAGGQWDRVLLRSLTEGPNGDGLAYSVSATGTLSGTAFTSALCCANTKGSRVTVGNPAAPGETIVFYATGLGITTPTPSGGLVTGAPYPLDGPFPNRVTDFLNNFINGEIGGQACQVLNAGIMPGTVGLYEVDVVVPPTLTTDQFTSAWIAQELDYSNVVTIPVTAP